MNTTKFTPLAHKMMCISQVTALDNAIKSAQGKSFHKSIEKAMLLLEGNTWLKSTEGITYLKEVAKITQEVAVDQAYGLKKAQYHLNIRIAKATLRIPNLVEDFLALCDAKQGAASYSIQNLDNYVKKLDNTVTNPLGLSEEGEVDGEGVTEGSVDVDTKAKPIITFTFNGEAMDMKNVSLRITDKGELKTSSTAEDVAVAIAYLQATLKKRKAETVAKVEVKAKASVDVAKKGAKAKAKAKVTAEEQAIADFEASLSVVEIDEDFSMDAPF